MQCIKNTPRLVGGFQLRQGGLRKKLGKDFTKTFLIKKGVTIHKTVIAITNPDLYGESLLSDLMEPT